MDERLLNFSPSQGGATSKLSQSFRSGLSDTSQAHGYQWASVGLGNLCGVHRIGRPTFGSAVDRIVRPSAKFE